MDLRKLQHMVALAEELNFSRAAEKVHLTQPALSRSIRALEQELGAKLFDRSLSSVTLTTTGRQVLERARLLLLDASNLAHDVGLMNRGELGYVSLGIGPFPGASFLPQVLSDMVTEKRQIRVDVQISTPDHLLEHLLDERIEFFVAGVRAIKPDKRIQIRPLARQYFGFLVRPDHPLAGQTIHNPAALLKFPLASVRLTDLFHHHLNEYFELAEGEDIPLAIVCDSPALLDQVGKNTDTIVLTTYAAALREISDGNLVALSMAKKHDLLFTGMGVASLAGRTLSASAEWLIEQMQRHATEMSTPDLDRILAQGEHRARR